MTGDLTAVLVPLGEHDEGALEQAVRAAGYGDLWLRLLPLQALGLWQIEVYDALGRPCLDPALVQALSQAGKRAVFVHVHHAADQAILHAFRDGRQTDGWVGGVRGVDGRLRERLGHSLAALIGADDDASGHPAPGVAGSATLALVRGRRFAVPSGTVMALGTFGFHDSGHALDASDRLALVALDHAAVLRSWQTTPGRELAVQVAMLPPAALGPLARMREEVVQGLTALAERSPAQAGVTDKRWFELVALLDAYFFAAGDAAAYFDERFLPMLTLGGGQPVFGPGEAESLVGCPSVLGAMVEVLPYASPEGSLLCQISDAEVTPFGPDVEPGQPWSGSLFLLHHQRLGELVGALEPRWLVAQVDAFYRAWWQALGDAAPRPDFHTWRTALDQQGQADMQRFVHTWAQWSAVLGLAQANDLATALWFYAAAPGSDG